VGEGQGEGVIALCPKPIFSQLPFKGGKFLALDIGHMHIKSTLNKLLDRRSLVKSAGAATAGLSLANFWSSHDDVEAATQNVNKNSRPSDLKITDLRVATLKGVPFISPIIRVDTNQGIYGLGEVRDGASKNYALFLKSRLLGENPCNVDRLFRKIKQFGGPSRQAGGVCGVEMALWDLAGKAYNVPAYPDARREVSRQDTLLRGYD
jgi:hypothetical protein